MIYLMFGIAILAFFMWQTSKPQTAEREAALAPLKEPFGVVGIAGACELVLGFGWAVEGVFIGVRIGVSWLFSDRSTQFVCAVFGYGFSLENDRLPEWKVPKGKPIKEGGFVTGYGANGIERSEIREIEL